MMKQIKSLSLKKSNTRISGFSSNKITPKTKILSSYLPNIPNKSIVRYNEKKNIYEKKNRFESIQTSIGHNIKIQPHKYPLKINSSKRTGLTQFCCFNQVFKKLQEENQFIQKLKAIFQKQFNSDFQQFYRFFYKRTIDIVQMKQQKQLLKSKAQTNKCLCKSEVTMASSQEKNTSLNDLSNNLQIPVMKKLQMLEDPFKGTFNINYDPFGFSYQDFFLKQFKSNLSFQSFKISDEDAKFMRNGVVQCLQLFQDIFAQIAAIQQRHNQIKKQDQSKKIVSKIISNIKVKVEELQKNMKMQYTIFEETRGKINQIRYQLMV